MAASVSRHYHPFHNNAIEITSEGLNVLYDAIRNKQPETVETLITYGGVDPSVNNNYALFYACGEGDLEVFKTLLSHSKVVPYGVLLHYAAIKDKFDVVDYLCESTDALKTAGNGDIDNVFMYAVRAGDMPTFQRFLNNPAIDDVMLNNCILPDACEHGRLAIVKVLLQDERVIPTEKSLSLASINGHVEVMKVLLADKRIDPTANTNDALSCACGAGQLDAVQLLFSCPTVIKYADCEAMIEAARICGPHENVIEYIRGIQAYKVALADHGKGILAAAKRNDYDLVEILLRTHEIKAGLDRATRDNLFYSAVAMGHLAVVQLLMDSVDPTAYQNVALMRACDNGYLDIVDALLIHRKSNLAVQGHQVLAVAARKGDIPMVTRLLVDGRIDASAEGNFALFAAIQEGQLEAVELLMKNAKVRAALDFIVAIDKAIEFGQPAITGYLKQLARNQLP